MLSFSRQNAVKVTAFVTKSHKLNKKSHVFRVLSANFTGGPDSDFIQQSKLSMDHFQKSLPRLKIPELPKTCERYLASQRVILNDEQFNNTEKIVNAFRDGEGKALHDELVAQDQANKHTSYISAPWYDMYLKDRRPVSLNHNPFMAINDDKRPEYNNQLIRATNFVISSMRFLKSLRGNVLEPEVFHLNPEKSDTDSWRNVMRMFPKSLSWYGAYLYKAFPLDMSQFPYVFNGTRIPRTGKDEIFSDPKAKHILIMRRGHFYVFDTLDKDGNLIPDNHVLAHMKYILEDDSPPAENPIGVLTTENRDTWAGLRQKLEQAGNSEALGLIDNAHYALVLDDAPAEDPAKMARQFLHSDGNNRWYDKCVSIIMAGNGKACINFEHSWGDGVAVLRFFNELYKDTTESPRIHPDSAPAAVDSARAVRKLEFNVTDEVKQGIKKAQEAFNASISSLDLNYIQYPGVGKNFIKKQKLSPDSFMQLAIQLAYYRQSGGDTAATYESCSTSAFRHGRTETVRPATSATKRTCEMFGKRASAEEIRAVMAECSKMHGELTKNAAMGQGFDRHLFAIKYLAAQKGSTVPDLFQDPAYAKLNHIILSTSTLSSPAILIGGFGPVVPNGYGIGYGIEDDQLGFIVTSYREHRDVNDFLDCMKSSVDDMKTVLEGGSL